MLSLIIDANHCAYRVFHTKSGQNLATTTGVPSGILHGFLQAYCSVYEQYKPDQVLVVWDRKSRHRKRIIEAARKRFESAAQRDPSNEDWKDLLEGLPEFYKASRYLKRTDGDHNLFQDIMIPQQRVLQEILPAIGAKQFIVPEVEGDDLIGILADRLVHSGDVIIVSSDRDLFQLLGCNGYRVAQFDPIKKVEFTETAFRDQHSIYPAQYVDVKALQGDAGDDIPGVPGVGEKTAFKLVSEYGGLVEVLAACEQAPKTAAMRKIPKYRPQIEVAYDLSYILSSAEELDPDQAQAFEEQWSKPVAPDWDEVRNFTEAYELRAVWKNLQETVHAHQVSGQLSTASNLTELYETWGDCQRCPLGQNRVSLVKYSGPAEQVQLAVIGDAPGTPEDMHGRPMLGVTGEYLDDYLLIPNGIDPKRVHKMYALCCHPSDRRGGETRIATAGEVASCRPRLYAHLKILRPKVCALIGDKALKTLFPDSNRISDDRGLEFSHPEFPHTTFVPVFSPGYVMREGPGSSVFMKSRQDWSFIKQLIDS